MMRDIRIKPVFGVAIIIVAMAMSSVRYITPSNEAAYLFPVTPASSGNLTAYQRMLVGDRIDINKAGERDLQALSRIGPALAARIVEERERGGPFGSVEELMRVQGIGKKILERNRTFITVR